MKMGQELADSKYKEKQAGIEKKEEDDLSDENEIMGD